MATLKETALQYEPAHTYNIADLDVVSTAIDVKYDTGTDKEGKEFSYAFIEVDEKQYRIPNSVIGQLHDLMEANPKLSKFRVKKSGEGMQTRYTVIPLV